MEVDVVEASATDKTVLRRLCELYRHDLSEMDGRDVDEHGEFGYRYLDHYWTETDRRPFLIRVDGRWAGFVLVRIGQPHRIAEFFVMRKYRRQGVGRQALRQVVAQFPGIWEVHELAGNAPAIAFWRASIPYPYTETETAHGATQRFTVG